MDLTQLYPALDSTKRRKRVGRGSGSGHGKTSTRGHKGQKARSGAKSSPYRGFEGGQMPLARRIPKKGFRNIFRKEYNIVNISSLNKFKPNTEVTKELLLANQVIRKKNLPIKLLGKGEIKTALTIVVDRVSKSALEKIEKAGGKVNISD
ncbi:MAG: 50S ribosomal protein L15 [bacterium]|nr:50S ribosomal protein L15 [bacterium]